MLYVYYFYHCRMAFAFKTTNECMPLEEKIQLRKVQLCELHVEPITEIPHKLSDICNLNKLNFRGNVWKYQKSSHYRNTM